VSVCECRWRNNSEFLYIQGQALLTELHHEMRGWCHHGHAKEGMDDQHPLQQVDIAFYNGSEERRGHIGNSSSSFNS
jgi:hypothetical protein